MTKSILITGASGFLGSHLTQRFVDEGFTVIILKKSSLNNQRINHLQDKIISYDIDKIDLSTPFCENSIDAVIHTATLYGRSNEKSAELIEVNLLLPLKVLELAVSSGTKIFINTDTVLNKNTNNYSLSKTQFLEWLKFLKYDIRIFNLKLEHIYGDRDDFSKFIPYIINELLLKKKEICGFINTLGFILIGLVNLANF